MIGIGLECGFAELQFDICCAAVMKWLASTRNRKVVVSVVFVSPSSPIPSTLSQLKVLKVDKLKQFLRVVVSVPVKATEWDQNESLCFIKDSLKTVVGLTKEKLNLSVLDSEELTRIVEKLSGEPIQP